jgi:hypothetical protein
MLAKIGNKTVLPTEGFSWQSFWKTGSRAFHIIFAFAVWRAKEAQSVCEVLGDHRGQSQQSRLEFGLCLSD